MVAVLIGWIVGVVAVVFVVVAAVVFRRRARDDEHSVEHYHRQLHTLEELRAHEAAGAEGGQAPGEEQVEHYPVSAVRVAARTTVGVTGVGERLAPHVPPLPPPRRAAETGSLSFDDTGGGVEEVRRSFMTGSEDRALGSINHRPRRLGGPLAALCAVAVLVVVLVVTGLHTTSPAPSPHGGSGPNGAGSPLPAVVSGPGAESAHRAEYRVAVEDYALTLAATAAGPCPVAAGVPARRLVLFSAQLPAGQTHTVTAKGTVTVIAGSATTCAVSIDGAAVRLPEGARAPVTLVFRAAPAGQHG